ncbi:MAG TPA: hypothetical protein DC009_03370, partial [Porphyromonadaceae bacterium]|nr:hypothetical protein [Porphyromonadaceae bacterium]
GGQYIVPLDWYTRAETGLTATEDKDPAPGRGIDCLNNKDFPSIIYSTACITAPFDKYESQPTNQITGSHIYDIPYNLGSAFTVAGNYGGPAYLGNTREGLLNKSALMEAKWGTQILDHTKIGIAEAISKLLSRTPHLASSHHLIGEPEFEMWLGKPGQMGMVVESTDNSIQIASSELDSSTVCLFDGNSKRVLRNISGTDISIQNTSSLSHYTLSVWKPGFLPFIRFYGAQGTLSDFDEKFIVLDAEIGEQYTGTLPVGRAFCVGSNATLTIEALKAVNVNRSCIIEEGGTLTIAGDDKVTLNCTVKTGGKLKVTAKSIQMGNGFTVEPGGTLDIQYK